MIRKLTTFVLVIFVATFLVYPAAMAKSTKGRNGQAGKSNIGHLYFYEKTGEPDWDIVEGGAWGKMMYLVSGPDFLFVFNGHGLEPGTYYKLIYYPDPWPGSDLICLGMGLVNDEGNIHIMGMVDTGDLPAAYDENAALEEPGAKIWLVLDDDVSCADPAEMTAWNPGEYLFEDALMTFEDTNDSD